jgi:O-antigen ligase
VKSNNLLKQFDVRTNGFQASILISIALILPVILLGENAIIALPIVLLILLAYVFGEKFILSVIIISLFILVGEVSRTLRSLVYVFDFAFLGFYFLKRFGLNFSRYPRIPRSVVYFLILYFSAMIISSIMSKYPFAGIGLIAQQLSFFVIVYVLFALLKDVKDIKLYFNSIIVVGLILVSASLFKFFSEGVSLIEIISPGRPRVVAIISNIESFTNFFVVSFPFLISYTLLEEKLSDKRINYLILFYFCLGLILTMSRSAVLGILFSSAVIFYLLRRKLFYKLIFSLAVVAFIFVFYQPLNELLTTFLRIESGMSARDYLWKMSMDMINENMIFGIGPGAYQYEMLNYFPYMLDNWWGKLIIYFIEVSGGANLSHNFFLTFFTDMGILGILTAITLPIIYFRIGIKTLIKFKNLDRGDYYLVIALFSAGSSIILRNFFNGIGLLYVGGIQTDLPFWLIFGSLIYYYQMPLQSNQKLKDKLKFGDV